MDFGSLRGDKGSVGISENQILDVDVPNQVTLNIKRRVERFVMGETKVGLVI
jgi:hypothetical protein